MARFSSHSSVGSSAQNFSPALLLAQQSCCGLNHICKKNSGFRLIGIGQPRATVHGIRSQPWAAQIKAFFAHHQKGILGFRSGPGTPGNGPGRRPLWRPPIAPSVFYKVLSGDKGLCENCELAGRHAELPRVPCLALQLCSAEEGGRSCAELH